MDVYLIIANTFLVFMNGWMIWFIKNLKSSVDSQQKIIDSFVGQTEFLTNLQSTLSKIYNPNELKSILDVKEMALRASVEANIDALKNQIERLEKGANNDVSKLELFYTTVISGQVQITQIRRLLTIYTYFYGKEKQGIDNLPVQISTELSAVELEFSLISMNLNTSPEKRKQFIDEQFESEKLVHILNSANDLYKKYYPELDRCLKKYGY